MPNHPLETGPDLPEKTSEVVSERTDVVDTQQLATAILTGCASGADISGHLATLGKLEPTQRNTLQRQIGTLLAEHTDMLEKLHHWMTLQKVGRDEYSTILRYALERASGIGRLTMSTKLADILRRETDTAKKIPSLDEAESILVQAIIGAESEKGSPEKFRALSSVYYTHSFVSFGRAEMAGEEQENVRAALIQDALTRLDVSKRYAEEAGDHESAAQSQIRWCAVHIDMNIGDMANLVTQLDALVKKLQGASTTWGNRFLNNALGHRVEAAAKCNYAEWEVFYHELMQRPDLEKQYDGADKFKMWKEKNCPPALKKEEGLA